MQLRSIRLRALPKEGSTTEMKMLLTGHRERRLTRVIFLPHSPILLWPCAMFWNAKKNTAGNVVEIMEDLLIGDEMEAKGGRRARMGEEPV